MPRPLERRRIHLPSRDIDLSVLDWGGTGPVLLLAHANGFCADVLAPLGNKLSDRFHVLAYDARGHGESQAPNSPEAYRWLELIDDQIALIGVLRDEFGFDSVAWGIGHSMGASVMLAAAARSEGLFKRIDLIDPIIAPPSGERTGFYAGEGEHPLAMRARKRRRSFPSLEELRARWAERGTYGDWDPGPLGEWLAHGFRESSGGGVELRCDPEVEACIYEGGRDLDFFQETNALSLPARYLHSERGFVPRDLAQRFVAQCDSMTLEAMPFGHFAPMENPEALARQLLGKAST
jgi:pimeloyl-ACP methyl ester carboxylesterase